AADAGAVVGGAPGGGAAVGVLGWVLGRRAPCGGKRRRPRLAWLARTAAGAARRAARGGDGPGARPPLARGLGAGSNGAPAGRERRARRRAEPRASRGELSPGGGFECRAQGDRRGTRARRLRSPPSRPPR